MRACWLGLWALVAVGCAAEDDPGVVDDPTADAVTPDDVDRAALVISSGGCGDTTLYLHDSTDTHALFLQIPGLVDEAQLAGTTVTKVLHLPDPDASVRFEVGRRLTVETCVGARPPRSPRVIDTFEATAGTLRLEAVPDLGGGATVGARLRGLVVTDAAGRTLRLGSLVVPPTSVGFYPP